MFDQKLAATQRLHQPDLVVYEQVISISLEGLKLRIAVYNMGGLSFVKAEGPLMQFIRHNFEQPNLKM